MTKLLKNCINAVICGIFGIFMFLAVFILNISTFIIVLVSILFAIIYVLVNGNYTLTIETSNGVKKTYSK